MKRFTEAELIEFERYRRPVTELTEYIRRTVGVEPIPPAKPPLTAQERAALRQKRRLIYKQINPAILKHLKDVKREIWRSRPRPKL